MTLSKVYFPLDELAEAGQFPLGDLIDDVFEHIWITRPSFDETVNEGVIGVFVDQPISFKIPGIPALELALGSMPGGVNADIRARFLPVPHIGIELPLTLRVDASILRPLKAGTNEPDLEKKSLDVALDSVRIGFDTDGHFTIDFPTGVTLPRCMIGSTGVILSVSDVRWLTPNSADLPATTPAGFNGLHFERASVEIRDLPLGEIEMHEVYIGTGGFSGTVDWIDRSVAWTGSGSSGSFSGIAAGKIFEFKGALTKVEIAFQQNAFTACTIEGNIFAPYLDKVIGLSLGLDGNGGLTAVAQGATCTFVDDAQKAIPAPAGSGYILTADTKAFKLDISRIEFHAGGSEPASLSLAGRAKIKSATYDIPAVAFKGLRIDTAGHVTVEGGWLDVEKAKSSSLKGFPFQVTKIGFGAEADGRRWVGLNGGIKLAEGLPIGVSVEGLRVTWNPANSDISFALGGIGLELKVPGTFSFAGKVTFFDTDEATGFRGSVKLKLDSLKVSIDAGMMVGQTRDGTSFFFLFLEAELPAGIPLFASGAAIFGFAGLLATNLKPNKLDGEDWYYGYYRRPPVGVTDPEKWGVQRDSFAIGLGATVGSLPDTGFAFSAKALLVVALPGPQLLLQGKGNFLKKKPDNKTTSSEGDFEALLVLDVPAKLFQANLAAAFKIPSLVEIAGGINVAFSWAQNPPPDLWHIYLGEKKPDERRIHAKLFKFLQGDSWLMVNRPGTITQMNQLLADDAKRLGEFEMGSALGIDLSFDFVIVKAWLNASLVGQAAISSNPQQFFGQLTLRGSAGVSVLGLSIVADLLADARVKAPNPWYFAVDIEVGITIDLLVEKLEFRVRLPLEFGNEKDPLPEPVTELVSLHSDHAKVDEAMLLPSPASLASPFVPPDVRPLVVFRRPVQDRARFGSPGRDDLLAEDLGIRQVSYQLRHVVLLNYDAAVPRLAGAAGELSVSGNTATFSGLSAAGDRLPDLSGASITLFRADSAPTSGLSISASNGDSATIVGSPPQGTFSYRLTAPRPNASIQISHVGNASTGEAVVTVAGAIASPAAFRGGDLKLGSASWLILDATATTVRIRTSATLPGSGAATLLGPEPAVLEGKWAPTGEPVTGADSSSRLQVWARTPFAFYRHNELSSIEGLDAFKPGYACGPTATEEPTCSQFEDVALGPLAGRFSTAGVSGSASGFVAALQVGRTAIHSIRLGAPGSGAGTVRFTFDPPVEEVWITGEAQEAGSVKVYREGAVTAQESLGRINGAHHFTGGIDQVEVAGMLATLSKLCFLPGWTCVHFEEQSFPQGSTGDVSYAGLKLASSGKMTVDAGMLEVVPPILPGRQEIIVINRNTIARAATRSLKRNVATTNQPMRADFASRPSMVSDGPIALSVPGLVESVNVALPTLGTVRLVPGKVSVPGSGRTPPLTQPGLLSIEPLDIDIQSWRHEKIDIGKISVNGKKHKLATITIVFPRPVTRVRVVLGSPAEVLAFAGGKEVCRSAAGSALTVSLYADPAATAHIGWIDRIVLMAPSMVRLSKVCTDAGNLGWARYEQWKWSQGVQRSVESLYRADPVLAPGNYELRVHTATVVTGEQPTDILQTERGRFTVGAPAGFSVAQTSNVADAGMQAARYPNGGPLTQFDTYVQRTMPPAGTAQWYRNYDTAVGFNESYVTRMYLDAGHDLRVHVVNASGVAIRSAARHVWSGADTDLDATTTQYIRTLNGDGIDPCATVKLDQVVRPESVTAGSGESLEPASLHASEIRSAAQPTRVLHRFEFVTSRYFSFMHHIATFDGLCRRLTPASARVVAAISPRAQAGVLNGLLNGLAGATSAARDARDRAGQGAATGAMLDAAASALALVAQSRSEIAARSAAVFDEIWQACFAANNPPGLPSEVRLSVVQAATAANGTDVLLLESPEPIAWNRLRVGAMADATLPLRKQAIAFASDFGQPDAGFAVEYGGVHWHAGVELWVTAGELRARADEPLDVSLSLDQAVSIEIVLHVNEGGAATIDSDPPQAGAAIVQGPSATPVTVNLSAPAGSTLRSARVAGGGVGIVSCSVTRLFVPALASGSLRITDIRLPTSTQPVDHEVMLMAMDTVALDGYTLHWIDARSPDASQLYVSLPSVTLRGGQRLKLLPGLASSPVSSDTLVHAGGAVTSPPATGAIYQLRDPAGKVVHESAAMPSGQSSVPGSSMTAIPNSDGTRAFLVPPASAPGIERGYWTVYLDLVGDAGPDLDRWSTGGVPVNEGAKLRFTVT